MYSGVLRPIITIYFNDLHFCRGVHRRCSQGVLRAKVFSDINPPIFLSYQAVDEACRGEGRGNRSGHRCVTEFFYEVSSGVDI